MTPLDAHSGQVAPTIGGADALSHLVARRPTNVAIERLAWAVRAAQSWLGPEVDAGQSGMHRYHVDMRLRVSDHPSIVTFRKAAYVDIGLLKPLTDGWEAEIGWRASSLAPLFPVFAGSLVVRSGELSISGWYAPPGGTLGRAADKALLHIAAGWTARWLLDELDKAAAQSGA